MIVGFNKIVPSSGSVLVKDTLSKSNNKVYTQRGTLKDKPLTKHERTCLIEVDFNTLRALSKLVGKPLSEALNFAKQAYKERKRKGEFQNAEAFKKVFLILNALKKSRPVQNIVAGDFLLIPATPEACLKPKNKITDHDLRIVRIPEYAIDFIQKKLNGKSIDEIFSILAMEIAKYDGKLKNDHDGHLLEELQSIQLIGQMFGMQNQKFWLPVGSF